MIPIKTEEDIRKLRRSAQLLCKTFRAIEKVIREGVKTGELDRVAEETILAGKGKPAFKGYRGFPASICVSIDDEVVHGIPGDRIVQQGEIVSIDIGVLMDGFYSDAAKTYGIGIVDTKKIKLMSVTKQSLHKGINQCLEGNYLSDISCAIQNHVESNGFSVVRALVGHGVGASLHEEPQIPNFAGTVRGPRLKSGMVFAIEPMVNMGGESVEFMDDGWTVKTQDGTSSAHYEHTVLITNGKPEILTMGIEDID